MGFFLPATIGVLFACGFFLLMSPYFLRVIFGFLMISQAVNLLLFAVGGLTADSAPLIPENAGKLAGGLEPLSQALILTAIVIGFSATAFLVVLARQSAIAMDTDKSDDMREAEL